MRTLLLVLLTSLPLPALAQSSLGISGGQLSLGLVEDEAGDHRGGMRALVDVDGRAFMYGTLGAEGMLSLGPDTSVEARAGVGWGDVDGLDYIFAGGAIAHRLTLSLGTSGGTDPHTRPFRIADPVAPLVRRGLW